jgi:glycosyltransferase involved in cell wall biosynthesis
MESGFTVNVLIITNIPSPYRVLQFNRLAKIFPGNLCVIYYQVTEPNRNWNIPKLEHRAVFLKHTIFSGINFHPDIYRYLKKERPNIIIASGFTPTVLFTFIYTKLTNKKFIVFTDSWIHSVNKLKVFHKLIRKFIIPRANASICVGTKGKEFLTCYGAKEDLIFISPLAIDNVYYLKYYKPLKKREFDIIFSGQFIDTKMPFFAIEVLKGLKEKKSDLNFLLIGSGPLEQEIITRLERSNIKYSYPGFIQQEDLPKYYANAKVLIFPTLDDPWGVVANEACAAGTPVITCENAGAANDLVIHNFNGLVLPLSVNEWIENILRLFSDSELYNTFSKNSLERIKLYSVENAANGIKNTINYLLANGAN